MTARGRIGTFAFNPSHPSPEHSATPASSAHPDAPHAAVLEAVLRDAGMLVTQQRKRVLGALVRVPAQPLSAAEVYRLMLDTPDALPPSTIADILRDMAFAGLVSIERNGRGKYRYVLKPARRAQFGRAPSE